MKKRKGSIIDGILSLLGILAAAIIIFAFFTVVSLVGYKEEVKGLARCYLLDMETQGHLTASSATSLRQELMDKGVTDIDLSGSTMSPVGYGNVIHLKLECALPAEVLNMASGDMLTYFFEDKTFPICVELQSTAKY